MDKSLRNELLDIGEKLFNAGRDSVVAELQGRLGISKKTGRKRGRPQAGVSKKVLNFLGSHKTETFTTPDVVKATKCNSSSVTGALFRLFKGKKISKPKRGLWQGK